MEQVSGITATLPRQALATNSGKPYYAYVLLAVLLLNFVEAGGHDQQRALELVMLCAAGLTLAWQATVVQLPRRQILLPLGAFFALGLVSSAVALAPRYAFYEACSLMLLLLVVLMVARTIASEPSAITHTLQLFGAVAALYALKILVVYVSVWLLQAVPASVDFTPGFSNIRHFNHAETVGLPMLALLYVRSPKGSPARALAMIAAVVWWAVLIATGGRGTGVGVACGTLLVLVLRRGAALPFLRALLLACVAGAVAYLVFFVLLPILAGRLPFGDAGLLVQRTMADPVSGRDLLWKLALQLIVAHPWLGVGPLHFAHYGAGLHIGAHPHDWVLQIAVEWGLPALCSLCLALAFAGRALWRAGLLVSPTDQANQDTFTAWLFIGAAVLVDGLVSGNLVMPQSQLMIALYLACAIGWTASVAPSRAKDRAASGGYLIRFLGVAAAATLAWSVAPQFIEKATDAQPSAAEVTATRVTGWWPRLWRDGYF